MAYATLQDLIDRFGAEELIQRTDRTNLPPTTIDATVVAAAIADAEALVDSYLAKAYRLPLAEVSPVLTRTTADVARYHLLGEVAAKDTPAARAYDQAIAWLRDVARGVVALVQPSTDAPPTQSGAAVRTSGPARVMSRDNLRGL